MLTPRSMFMAQRMHTGLRSESVLKATIRKCDVAVKVRSQTLEIGTCPPTPWLPGFGTEAFLSYFLVPAEQL